MQKSGKDNSGEKIYRRIVPKDEEGLPEKEKERKFLLDPHDHLIVDRDLYNHEGLTEDGIAEAFIEFAKKEKFSFFEQSLSMKPFDAVRYQQLMDRLEAVELSLSEAYDDNTSQRIDSEYFKKEYIQIQSKVKQGKKIQNLTTMTDLKSNGAFKFLMETLNDDKLKTIAYIRSGNVGNFLFPKKI